MSEAARLRGLAFVCMAVPPQIAFASHTLLLKYTEVLHMTAPCSGKLVSNEQVAALEASVRKCQARMEQLCQTNDRLTAERDALREQCTNLKVQRVNANSMLASQKEQVGGGG